MHALTARLHSPVSTALSSSWNQPAFFSLPVLPFHRVLDHAIADLSRQQKEQLRELSKSAAATAAPGSAGSGSSGAGAGAGSKRGASGAGAPAAAAGGASSKQQARAKRAKGAKDHAIEFLSQVLKDKETAMQANALGGDAAEAGATEDA